MNIEDHHGNLEEISKTIFTCQDDIQNGDETGVDCGGSTCPPCNGNGSCGSAAEFPTISTEMICHPSLGTILNFNYEGGAVGGYQYTADVDGITGQFTLDYPLPNIGDNIVGFVLGFDAPYGTLGYSFNASIHGCDPNQILFNETIQSIDCQTPCSGNGSCGSAAEFPMLSTALSCDPNNGVLLTFYYEGGGVGDNQYTVDVDGQLSQFTLSCPLPNIGDQIFGIVFSHPTVYGVPGNFITVNVNGCDPNIILYNETIQSIDCLPPCQDPVDYTALRALYLSTDGDNWSDNTGWPDANFFSANPSMPSATNLSSWNGLVCENNRITYIQLPNNNLTGTIPSEIGLLSNLQTLDLGDNNLTGTIPIELWNLTNLQFLSLEDGSLTGQLPPEIANLFYLRDLLLGNNNLSGTLPTEMKGLTNLHWISLSFNSFSGTIDDDFFEKWSTIHDVRLDFNQFSGDLPTSLGDRTSLRVAALNNNQFTGCFPYNYKNLCTNKDNFPFGGFSFGSNIGLGTNDGDFDAFCTSEAGLCPTTIDCNWVELTINTGVGPLFFKYNMTPFDYECNPTTIYTGEYYLNTDLPNTSLNYVHELDENWYKISVQNDLYDGSDLTQTIEVKDHSTGNVLIPQSPIEDFFFSDDFPLCNAVIVNQNLTVSNNNDRGPGSLRQAIHDANCTFGEDDISILTTGIIDLTSCGTTTNFGADCFIILPQIRDDVNIFGNGITLSSTSTTGRLFYNRSNLSLKDLTIDNIDYRIFGYGTGGAIWNGGNLSLENVTISNSHASGAGGAIYSYGVVNTKNCTFSNNSAGDRGGAIGLHQGTATINHCTFSDNSANEGGAIYTLPNNVGLNLHNSIFANSQADADLSLGLAPVTNDNNLVETCVGNCPTFDITTDPQLGPLQDNGGVTFTHALLIGSPGSVVSQTTNLSALVSSSSESISYSPNGCANVSVTFTPFAINYACALGNDGIAGTSDDGSCIVSFSYSDNGNGTVTYGLVYNEGDPTGSGIPTSAESIVTVSVEECGPVSPAVDVLPIGAVLLDQRGYDIANGEKDLGAYEYEGVDPDGCDLVEFEGTDIMGNTEDITALLMVGGDNKIDLNADVLYQASQLIDLKPGFEVVLGSIFEAQIGPCSN